MKIIQVMPDFGLAGAEIMCENLIYELRKCGHDVVVISLFDYKSAITERMEQTGVKIIYLGKKLGFDISLVGKIRRVLRKEKADVIHTHRNAAQYAIPAAMMAGVKLRVHTVHNIATKENGKPARILNKFFFKYCRVIPVALSYLTRDSIVEEYKIQKNKIPVILNGIDLSKCIPKDNYGINGNFKILHIGRFSEQKNHEGLLKAFKVFHDKHPDSELWLIGDGEKKAEVERYVSDNDLIQSVRFLGLQSSVYRYLHDADIFALPSNYEGVPITLIEAMGTGLPIVATAVGGVLDMLDNDSAQMLDVEVNQIACAFERYYLNKNLRSTHGNEAKERSVRFSAKTMAQRYAELYVK